MGYWSLRLPSRGGAAWGRRGYPAEFRRKVLDLMESGRPVAEVAKALGISDQTIYTWRRQDRIDKGLEPGLTSGEKSELATAKQRIAALEAELLRPEELGLQGRCGRAGAARRGAVR